MTEPTYEMFTQKSHSPSGARAWLRSLEPGVPQRIPEHLNARSLRSDAYNAARLLGFKIAIRTIDGETWLCKLKPEDAQ